MSNAQQPGIKSHHRRSIRLPNYDYTQPGAYFITLCTWQQIWLFGKIINGDMHLNKTGEIVIVQWQQLENHYPNVHFAQVVIMPNHLHGIITIQEGATRSPLSRVLTNNDPRPNKVTFNEDGSPLPRPVGPPPNSIGALIGQFKSKTTKQIWAHLNTSHTPVWQRNYYEHVVRNDADWVRILEYIQNNPLRWEQDQLYRPA